MSGDGSEKESQTVPPPFDPEQFARDSELSVVRARPDAHETDEVPSPPPLNKRVSLAIPITELDWFNLSDGAKAFARHINGQTTLMELLELMGAADPPAGLEAVAQLQDAGVLSYEE
jgi:hypothetical protein